MATNQSIMNQMSQQAQTPKQPLGIKALLNSASVQEKFKVVLKDKAAGFTSSVLTLVNNDSYLAQVEPMSIMTGAMVSATLDLPLDKNLGYAYLIPFKGKAQFIIGYKGYIQLAMRSGQYKFINVTAIYEGQLKSWNPLTEEFIFDNEAEHSDVVIGYAGYFELLNGFKKTVYWTKEQIEKHRRKNAKGKDKSPTGVWRDDFDAMAQKTVLRSMLSKWGILSIEMQKSVTFDENNVELNNDNELVAERIDVTEEVTVTDEINEEAQVLNAEEVNSDGKLTDDEFMTLFPESADKA